MQSVKSCYSPFGGEDLKQDLRYWDWSSVSGGFCCIRLREWTIFLEISAVNDAANEKDSSETDCGKCDAAPLFWLARIDWKQWSKREELWRPRFSDFNSDWWVGWSVMVDSLSGICALMFSGNCMIQVSSRKKRWFLPHFNLERHYWRSKWKLLIWNEFNLQVVAVGNDVAAEVAVAAVVGDWKGFREGFPAKGGFVENGTCGQIATTNLGRVPRWASFASLSTTPSSSPYTWSTTSSGSTSAPHSLIISYNIWNIRCIRYNPDDIDQVHAPVSQQLSTLTPIFSPNYIPLFLLPPRKVRGDGLTSHGGSPALSKSSFCKLRNFRLEKHSI